MGRRFAFCLTCNRFVWARTNRKTGRCFCVECGEEIIGNNNSIRTPPPDNNTIAEDHYSYPEISTTGGLR